MEFARVAFSVSAALIVPAGLSWYKRPWYAISFALIYSALAIFPLDLGCKAWVIVGATFLSSLSVALFCRPWGSFSGGLNSAAIPVFTAAGYAAVAMLLVVVAAYAYIGAGATFDRLEELSNSDRVFVVMSGGLIAVVGCGDVIARIVKPLVDEIESNVATGVLGSDIREFVASAAHIGWIERILLFGFLASGKPEAAALVIAAKSFTRAPGISQGGKLVADYYLVGTLASVASALLVSCATRLALGLSPI
ncbi:hypothetical protein [Streptomyces sp. 5-10]|uniref:hypothetical protein n=1 Tax=Streptomyces sp. 5-10 TaxID=878925 RepID=UPI00168BA110|nr:hypothetical protein [Streptomyces sp. 5-10]MBD3009139.1 hypothetical protein [Streptomyces sp. 5-10]